MCWWSTKRPVWVISPLLVFQLFNSTPLNSSLSSVGCYSHLLGILQGINHVILLVRAPSRSREKKTSIRAKRRTFPSFPLSLHSLSALSTSILQTPGVILSLAPWLPGCVDECGWSVLLEGNGAVSHASSFSGVSFCARLCNSWSPKKRILAGVCQTLREDVEVESGKEIIWKESGFF